APENDDDVALPAVERSGRAFELSVARRGAVAGDRARELARDGTGFTRRVAQHRRRVLREPGRARRDLDHGHAEVDGGAAYAQVEDWELVLEVGADEDDRTRPVEVGDGGAGQAEHDLGREAVGELGVDVVG